MRAVAVMALGLPIRAASGDRRRRARSSAAEAHGRHAQDRGGAVGGRLVWELSRRPPEILFLGASVSQDVKCFSVGHRLMSVPISAISFSAL